MTPPSSKIICPGCRSAFDASTNYCPRCGTSLRASPNEDRVRKTEPLMPVPEALRREDSGPRDPLIGRVIDGRYKVLERLAAGGMGVVYRVEHQRMGKIAAMKVLHRDLASDREVMKRFRREAEAVSKLTHPNTVQTFDFGTADGAMYLVMEYVRGEDLGTILRREGPMPFSRAAPIFMQVCDALGEAHELGIIHRDVKPENILVTHGKDGHDHAKVLDFGLAKLSLPGDGADVSSRGEIVGTPFYMSPEQIRGDELDPRTDIYALGGVIYRVLTGEPPFKAQSPVGVLTRHLTDELVPATALRSDLPPRVDEILGRALAKDRADRYPTVDALRRELVSALAEISAPRPTVGDRVLPRPSAAQRRLKREDFDAFERSLRWRARARLLLIPLALATVAAAVVLYVRHQRQQPHEAEVEPNHDLMTATLIAAGAPVRGKIGQRASPAQGDQDHFRVALAGPGTLTAELTPIPNIDLTLVLFDEEGRAVAMADEGKVGKGEKLTASVGGKTIYLAVLERKIAGARYIPTENLSDEYTLTVRVAP